MGSYSWSMDEEMEVQQPAKQHGRRGVRPSTCPSPDLMASSESSFLARTADFTQEEDNRTRAERMADHREQNALLQARNMHVRDFFLENMRSERDRRNRQVSRDRSEKREMWNQRLRNRCCSTGLPGCSDEPPDVPHKCCDCGCVQPFYGRLVSGE